MQSTRRKRAETVQNAWGNMRKRVDKSENTRWNNQKSHTHTCAENVQKKLEERADHGRTRGGDVHKTFRKRSGDVQEEGRTRAERAENRCRKHVGQRAENVQTMRRKRACKNKGKADNVQKTCRTNCRF